MVEIKPYVRMRLDAMLKSRFPSVYETRKAALKSIDRTNGFRSVSVPNRQITAKRRQIQMMIESKFPTLAKKIDIMQSKVTPEARKRYVPIEELKSFSGAIAQPTHKQRLQQILGGTMVGSAAQKVQAAAAVEGQVIDPQTTWPINQFKMSHDVPIPKSEFGKYDIVRVTRFQGATPGSYTEEYVFDYSPIARHKIEVAGNVENYDRYLKMVREHPELAGLHLFKSFLNVDLALASNRINPRYGASPREEILIKHLHQWKGSPEGKGDLGRMGVAILENPFVQISLAEGGGMAIGKISSGISGRLAAMYGQKAVQGWNLAQLGVGTALTAPVVYDIGKKTVEGRYQEAIPEALMFGLAFGAGWEGYRLGRSTPKLWGKYKGLTPYEAGFQKGLARSKLYDPLQKEYFNVISQIKQDLRIRSSKIIQQDPTFRNVQALERYDPKRTELLRNAIKNQLIMLKGKAQASGGVATEKPSTHDIDNLFRSARDPVVLEYIARRLGMDPNMIFDPHQLPRTGDLITPYGTPKEAPYIYQSGIRGIRLQEQWYRLSESSAALAHEGRAKDITEAQRLLALIYQKQGGVPSHMQDIYGRYMTLSTELAAQPRLMDPKAAKMLYSSGLGKKFWDLRTKFYQKTLTKGYLNKQFNKLTAFEKQALTDIIANQAGGFLPPTPSMISPSIGYAGFFGGLTGFYTDPSQIRSIPITRSGQAYVDSNFISNLLYAFPGSINYLSDIQRGSISRRKGSKSDIVSYPVSIGSKSISRRKGSKSDIVSYPVSIDSKLYSDYYSPPPPTSSYYDYSDDYSPPPPYYYSESYSPPPPPIPPPPTPLWWPGGGGQVGSRGRIDPYMVQYINEWELMQQMLRDVIF